MIVIETLIYCDGGDCPLFGGALYDSDSRDESARDQLRGSGWLSKGGKHYCPDCRKRQ